MGSVLLVLAWVFGVVMIFNIMIFVHELGHFWAARWRGLKVDRFQIWFGKPLWSKEINGVNWGLGWLPMGGFVSLPQMAPMESIEGKAESDDGEPLPDISPLDKIIVAFAGPLFSFLLAIVAACLVWMVGKPADVIPTTEVGYVKVDGPADKAGLKVGDVILKVNDQKVTQFAGDLNGIKEQIMLTESDKIAFLVQRDGASVPVKLVSEFEIRETKFWQRENLPEVGISAPGTLMLGGIQANSPAEKAGMQAGDRILKVDGQEIRNDTALSDYIQSKGKEEIVFLLDREGQEVEVRATATEPKLPEGHRPLIGFGFGYVPFFDESWINPSPWKQIKDSGLMMWKTLQKVTSPKSKVGAQHLQGPIGIGKNMYLLAQTDHPFPRLLAFAVLLNVNLAILNMLPLPVLDGGHITMALYEMVTKRKLSQRIIEPVMLLCVVALLSFMVYVTSKDIGDEIRGSDQEEVVF